MVDKGLILASPWIEVLQGWSTYWRKGTYDDGTCPFAKPATQYFFALGAPVLRYNSCHCGFCWDLPGRPWLRRRHSTSSWPQIAKDCTSERFKLEKHERCRRKTSAGRAWYLLQLGTRDPTPAAKLSVYHSRADWAVDIRSNLLRLPVKVGNCHEYLRHP